MPSKQPASLTLSKGTFLVASPDIDSGIFFRSVVILCEHSSAGSFGLIVNKPLIMEMPQEIASLNQLTNPHIHMRTGGPLQPNQMMLLHNSPTVPEQSLELAPQLFLGGDLHFLQGAMSEPQGPSIYLCFGYAAWTTGNLDREFLTGNWLLAPSSSHHVFETSPEKLWQTLLREMGGKYAALSMIPEDLTLN